MRLIRSLILIAAATFAAQAAASSPAGDADVARPGGVYNLLTADDANACADACDADGICVAWTFQTGGSCELKAVIPAPIRTAGARSGISARAPESLRIADAAALHALAAEPAPQATLASATPRTQHLSHDNDELLGGVTDGDAPGGLRGSAGTR